ncbi:MAG: glycosyltransferase [Candidatus Sericytochromatia bacterium]
MRILMSMFGWRDSGGGTIFPRQLALELVRRGHDVLVISAAVPQIPGAPLYTVQEQSDEGVQWVGIHNRPAFFLDDQNPEREIHDPHILRIFRHYFEQFQPDLVHYHNFLGLSLGIADLAWEAGLPSFYTPYNFWLLCPTLYLNLPNLALCQGVNASGSNCLNCTQAKLPGERYLNRRDTLQAHYRERVGTCLATSQSVQTLMVENGYDPAQIDILKLGNERAVKIWQEAGEKRSPGVNDKLRIGFTGAVLPIKGVHTLVEAAQYLQGDFEILIYGEGPPDYLQQLKAFDRKGCVTFAGRFEDADHASLLCQLDLGVVPSVCYDHSPLVIGEFQAARVPVIGAEIGGIPDYLQAGTGALYPAGDARALAQRLQALIDDPSPIPRWQALMMPPLSFADYVEALEQRYLSAQAAGADKRFEQRLKQFLKLRRPEWRYYDAQTLQPLAEPKSGCGVDLVDPHVHMEPELSLTLLCAAWLSVSEAPLLPYVYEWVPELPHAVLPPQWPGPWPPPLGELPTDKPFRLLMFYEPGCPFTEPWLKAYLQAYHAESEIALVLMPHRVTLEEAQDKLLDWMVAEGFDPESGPELVLLNPADFGPEAEWAGHFNAIVWHPFLMTGAWIRSRWQRGPVYLGGTFLPEELKSIGFAPLALPTPLQALQAQLPHAQFVQPYVLTADEEEELLTRLKNLLQGESYGGEYAQNN